MREYRCNFGIVQKKMQTIGVIVGNKEYIV